MTTDKDVAPVEVKNDAPIPVALSQAPDTAHETTAKVVAAKASVDAATITTLGQRRVNLIWEVTQALIALAVTFSTLFVAALLSVRGNTETAAFLLMSNAFFLVVGFYFGRTNHQRTGGVGPNDMGR